MTDFSQIFKAINVLQNIDDEDTATIISEFAEYSNQEIPESAVSDFRFSGLSNTDLLMSDYLHKYGIKNLKDIESL